LPLRSPPVSLGGTRRTTGGRSAQVAGRQADHRSGSRRSPGLPLRWVVATHFGLAQASTRSAPWPDWEAGGRPRRNSTRRASDRACSVALSHAQVTLTAPSSGLRQRTGRPAMSVRCTLAPERPHRRLRRTSRARGGVPPCLTVSHQLPQAIPSYPTKLDFCFYLSSTSRLRKCWTNRSGPSGGVDVALRPGRMRVVYSISPSLAYLAVGRYRIS